MIVRVIFLYCICNDHEEIISLTDASIKGWLNEMQVHIYLCASVVCFELKYIYIRALMGFSGVYYAMYVQGEWMQTVTSNLALTDRKNVITFNLKGFSVQGRLEIYP